MKSFVVSGRHRPFWHCACLADGADPCRQRARPRPRTRTPLHRRCGCVPDGGPIGQINFGVGCDFHVWCLPHSLKQPSHPDLVGPAAGHWPEPARTATRRVQVIRITLSGSSLLWASGQGRQRPRPIWWTRRRERRRGAPGPAPPAPTASGETPRMSGPGRAGWLGRLAGPAGRPGWPAGASPRAGAWAQN